MARSSSPAATSARCSPSPDPEERSGAPGGGHIASERGRRSLSALLGHHGAEEAATAAEEEAAAEAEELEAAVLVPAARLNVTPTKDRTRSMNLSSLSLSSPDHSRARVSKKASR
jgi:hypothetical protein